MLLSLEELAPLLVCPRCRAGLKVACDNYYCTNPTCALANNSPFPIIGDWPILVDFERSILVESEVCGSMAASVIPRAHVTGFKKRLKDALFPPNRVARQNVAQMRALLKPVSDHPILLTVGGGSIGSGVEALYADDTLRLIGFDIYGTPLTQFIADGHQIPLCDQSVDAVLVQAVLEHVLDPWQVVAEIYRVLKPHGLVYAETPFLQQVHEGPYDFTRFTESGHRYLFRRFERIASGAVAGPGTQLLWTVDHVSRSVFRSAWAGKLCKALFCWVQVLDRISPARYAIDDASGVFFLGRKAEREVQPREMVSYYQGAQQRSPLRTKKADR